MSYIFSTLDHVRAVKAWAAAHEGEATLDLVAFELEVKALHRYFTLYPQFLARINGRLAHVPQITPEVFGFIGWLPYRPLRWPLSNDKLAFKQLLNGAGLPTPALWPSAAEAGSDYILKQSVGSFGVDLLGPFREGTVPSATQSQAFARPDARGSAFVEQFIEGRSLKVWFWGSSAFHAHLQGYPMATGDGARSVRQLAAERVQRLGMTLDTYKELPFLLQSLAYQGIGFDEVPAAGKKLWLDFRYGRRLQIENTTETEDNALPRLPVQVRTQIDEVGRLLAREVQRTVMEAPLLYSVDGVIDVDGRAWWLEMNSNPIFPPTGYPHMLATLFGTPIPAHAEVPDAPAAMAAKHPAESADTSSRV